MQHDRFASESQVLELRKQAAGLSSFKIYFAYPPRLQLVSEFQKEM